MSGLKRNIPFFNYPALFAEQRAELMPIVEDVLTRGAYIMQRDLFDFEANMAAYTGAKHAIGMADGTMALTLGVIASGIGAGDEVIVPSHTFVASAAAIHHAGATPVLADCGPDHLIDPAKVETKITSRTKAIMPVQLNGRTADMEALSAIADRHGLMIVEDSCQALGSRFKGRQAGTFGRFGAISHYPAKTLGTFGDGGCLLTNDDEIAEKVRLMRDHGRSPTTGKIECWGFNARLDNLHAAILNYKLKTYDRDVVRRRDLAAIYDARLKDVAEVLPPPGPDADANHFDIFQNYEIEADRRDELRAHLDARGVKTIIQWGGHTLHQFEALGFDGRGLDYTERMTGRFLLLPMNTTLSDEDAEYICDQIRSFYGRA